MIWPHVCYFFLRMESKRQSQPPIKHSPPIGVIMPAGPIDILFIERATIKYNEPLNSTIPRPNRKAAIPVVLNGYEG